MMKVAIATEGGVVAAHFGRCPQYTLATIEDGVVTNTEIIDNPGHEPGFLPRYLAKRDVDVIISGGMGVRAQKLFDDAGIDYVVGVDCSVDECLRDYAAGTLNPGDDLCEH
ncbi:MAG: NifB/NifX family molybdenum-iron cluster-binding protein [Bacillota bacterium]